MRPTQQEIIELAREADLTYMCSDSHCREDYFTATKAELEKLIELALERFSAGGGEPPFLENPSDSEMEFECVALPPRTSLYAHPSPTDLRAEYLRGLEDAAKVALDADHMGSVNLKLMKNRISNAIEALKGKQ